ncbi:MAG: metallophosphoesterase [Oscillospiraceae bacterium]|jgi:predicted MPP superfamily phosphohydrolase|nr:metallophosphoesterase [Oscillospiraceae bacterium]
MRKFLRFTCRFAAIALCTAILSTLVSMLLCTTLLTTKHYTLQTLQAGQEIKIVLLSDLHGKSFGDDNSRLLSSIAAQAPHLIAVVGDMLPQEADSAEIESYCALVSALCTIAPTYISYGNEEKAMPQSLSDVLRATAAVVLEEEFVDISINRVDIRIGGMYNYAFSNNQTPAQWTSSATYQFLKAFEDTKRQKIMLCHRPDSFIFFDAYKHWDIDLLLSGHTHGGLIRLPFFGGMYVPDQGYLPTYDKGVYSLGRMQMVITSGFAGHEKIPRIFNLPELTVVTIKERG